MKFDGPVMTCLLISAFLPANCLQNAENLQHVYPVEQNCREYEFSTCNWYRSCTKITVCDCVKCVKPDLQRQCKNYVTTSTKRSDCNCTIEEDSTVLMEISTTPDPAFQSSSARDSTKSTLQPSANIKSPSFDDSFDPQIISIAIIMFLASLFIVQLLAILYLKRKNTVLQAKLNNHITLSKIYVLPNPCEGDEVEEVNECYGISHTEDETAEENYSEIRAT